MATYNFIEILNSIPLDIWKDLPTWQSAGFSQSFNEHNQNCGMFSTYNRIGTYKRVFKTQESFDYIKSILHTFHVMALGRGDEILFEVSKYEPKFSQVQNIDTLRVYLDGPKIKEKLVYVDKLNFFHRNNGREWAWASRYLWNAIRFKKIQEYKESIMTDDDKYVRSVEATKNMIVIASKLTKIEADIELVKQKIADGSLSKEDTNNFYKSTIKNLSGINKNKQKLPKE